MATGKGSVFANDLLKLIFQGTTIANLADNTVTSPLGSLFVALHTADPSTTAGAGTVNTQNASEASYTGYARQAVLRSATGFTVAGNTVTLAALTSFGACTAGSSTITHFSIGVASSGATKLLYVGTVTPNIAVSAPINPQLGTTTGATEA
jgi:hypothetical protein